jgi:hypothetical protein
LARASGSTSRIALTIADKRRGCRLNLSLRMAGKQSSSIDQVGVRLAMVFA